MHSHAAVSILAFSNSVGHSHAGRASLIGYVGGLADQLISARTLAHFVHRLFPKMLLDLFALLYSGELRIVAFDQRSKADKSCAVVRSVHRDRSIEDI